MLYEIDHYIDLARERRIFASDSELARALGVTPPTVNAWRMRRQWPSDDTLVHLAQMGGLSGEEALINLNIWRCRSVKSSSAHQLYCAIMGKIIATIIIFVTFGTTAEQVSARASPQYTLCDKSRRKRLTDWLTGWRRAVSNYRARALSPRAATC